MLVVLCVEQTRLWRQLHKSENYSGGLQLTVSTRVKPILMNEPVCRLRRDVDRFG